MAMNGTSMLYDVLGVDISLGETICRSVLNCGGPADQASAIS